MLGTSIDRQNLKVVKWSAAVMAIWMRCRMLVVALLLANSEILTWPPMPAQALTCLTRLEFLSLTQPRLAGEESDDDYDR